jgi:hypothetical protein
MKHRILTVLAALICLGLFVELSQPMVQNTKLSWVNLDWLFGRDNFYFKKRQWLADARTVVAGVRFVCETREFSDTSPTDVASGPHPLPIRNDNSTNFSSIGRPARSNRFLMAPPDPAD